MDNSLLGAMVVHEKSEASKKGFISAVQHWCTIKVRVLSLGQYSVSFHIFTASYHMFQLIFSPQIRIFSRKMKYV